MILPPSKNNLEKPEAAPSERTIEISSNHQKEVWLISSDDLFLVTQHQYISVIRRSNISANFACNTTKTERILLFSPEGLNNKSLAGLLMADS